MKLREYPEACVVCGGTLREERARYGEIRIGGPPRPTRLVGFNCLGCGLKYFHLPDKKKLRTLGRYTKLPKGVTGDGEVTG